ncbi:MAG: competence/damage-inducible protein CinA [Vampirovibrio sp.]|jgi:nicotinamide-nucleotide amidase|nr:competence/damage-inducible protein CinA [Vampirovibrio sp.]
MKAEIIAVGSELLMGDVVNSNAAWISRQLANLGVDVHFHVTVGDNPPRIHSVISQAIERSSLLIFTGGLGPTEDDLTIATIADYFQTPLISDPKSEETIKGYFIARGMPMSATNLKQAKKPEGAVTVDNPIGTAPGIAWDVSGKTGKPTYLLTFPGVPKELYAMWPQGVKFIRAMQQEAQENPEILLSRYLHFFGIGESKLGEMLGDLMANANPTVAPYVGNAEVKIRIAAKAPDEEQATRLIEPLKTEILSRCGEYYYGEDDCTLEQCVAQLLSIKGYSLATAESCTGGLISSRLTDVPGSSAYTFINMVTYGNMEKTQYLGVQPETLKAVGAVSPEVAAEMARGIKEKSRNDFGLSVTGIAGPEGGSEDKPAGLAYIGIVGPQPDAIYVKKVMVNSRYSRADIKYWFSQYALSFLLQALRGTLKTDYPELCGPTVAIN